MDNQDKKKSRIKPLTGGSTVPLSMTFTPEEVSIIDEMVTIFGDSREDVVIKAVSLLYTIYKEDEDAKNVFMQSGQKRVVIPLK